jgi:hypothetical protein
MSERTVDDIELDISNMKTNCEDYDNKLAALNTELETARGAKESDMDIVQGQIGPEASYDLSFAAAKMKIEVEQEDG